MDREADLFDLADNCDGEKLDGADYELEKVMGLDVPELQAQKSP